MLFCLSNEQINKYEKQPSLGSAVLVGIPTSTNFPKGRLSLSQCRVCIDCQKLAPQVSLIQPVAKRKLALLLAIMKETTASKIFNNVSGEGEVRSD